MLKALLRQMCAVHRPLDSVQDSYLEEAIMRSVKEYGDETTVTTVADRLLVHGETSARHVGQMLHSYTERGIYGELFSRRGQRVDLAADLVVLELGHLDKKPELQHIVLLMLIQRINHEMYLGERSRRKLCIIDEAWRLMQGSSAASFIETGYRTARKFGGSFMTITQGIDDYFQSHATEAALKNSDWVFLMRQKAESIARAKEKKMLQIDERAFALLSSLDTRQGAYSEVAVLLPTGALAVGRLIVDPFSEKLYSTRAEEHSHIQKRMREGIELIDAVEELVRRDGAHVRL